PPSTPFPYTTLFRSYCGVRRDLRSSNVSDNSFQARLAELEAHRGDVPQDMRAAFADDPARFDKFSLTDGDLLLDWSKCAVTEKRSEEHTSELQSREN